MKRIGIVDFTVGNIGSIFNAFTFIGYEPKLVNNRKELEKSDLIVLPGVGSFKSGMEGLKSLNIIPELENQILIRKKAVLGICLGMQILFKSSEENEDINGLGWIDGKIKKLDTINNNFPIPHVGWNDVIWEDKSKLKSSSSSTSCFYFVHSYGLIEKPNDAQLECYTEYGQKIIAGVRKNNISGFQFHPEKSQDEGLNLLENCVIQND